MNEYKKDPKGLKAVNDVILIDNEGVIVIKTADKKGALIIYPTFKIAGKYPAFVYNSRVYYIHRLVYLCFINPYFKGQLTVKDGNWDNMNVSNIIPGVSGGRGRKGVDPWDVRKMYCNGSTIEELEQVTGLKRQHLKNICKGFSGVKIEENEDGLMLFM